MDLVYMRSDWSGDESLCSFKCGPHIGHEAVRQFSFDPGSGHVHPDAGAFQIFAYGDWLIVDDGYTLKTTETQNTALINGIGQTGSGGAWFNGSTLCAENRGARIVTVESMREMDYVIGDVTDAYEKKAGLKKFVRQFYFIKPDVWIVVDRLEAAGPAEFELFLHSDWPFEKASENEYRLVGKSGEMSVFTVAPGDASVRGFKQPFKGTDGKPKGTIDALSVRNKDKSEVATFINVLCASRKGGENPVVSIESPDDIMRIKIQNNGHVRRIEIVLGAIDFNTPVLKLNR